MDEIRTLSVERLGKRMGHLSDDEMSQIIEGLNEIIGEPTHSGYRR
jgi:mRNA interferase MazF